MKTGKCELCLKVNQLHESHIVPKFMWKSSGLTGANKKYDAHCLSDSDLSMINLQDGLKEYLLCQPCEQLLCSYESYAREYYFGNDGLFVNSPAVRVLSIGINYSLLKLFHMSVLWRMNVSRLPFYSTINIKEQSDRIRQMLLYSDPGPSTLYGSTITLLTYNNYHMRSLFSQPLYLPTPTPFYTFVLAGACYLVHAFETPPPKGYHDYFLQENGTWLVDVQDIRNINYLIPLLMEVKLRLFSRKLSDA